MNQVQGLLKAGKNVLLDATNTSTEKRRRFCKQLPPCVRYMKVLHVMKAIAKDRIAKDLEKGTCRAAVPDGVLDRAQRELTESMDSIKEERWKMKV